MHIFSFKKVNSQDVMEKLRGLHVGKACGNDLILAKLIKLGKDALCCSLTTIINQCLTVSLFPEQFKCAVVVPLHKKDGVLRKENFGPVSILTELSKIVEGIMCDQLMSFLETRLLPFLCAYRPGYSCNNTLLKLVEEWKLALDKVETIGCILMDLSKSFD